jgi:uncharacterized membrane protein YecN with MAPEG domain
MGSRRLRLLLGPFALTPQRGVVVLSHPAQFLILFIVSLVLHYLQVMHTLSFSLHSPACQWCEEEEILTFVLYVVTSVEMLSHLGLG